MTRKVIAVDTETTGLDIYSPATQLLITATCDSQGRKRVYPRGKRIPELTDPDYVKVFWNAKFDLGILQAAGYELAGPIHDAALLARLVMTGEKAYTLKHFARKFLNTAYHEEVALKKYLRKNKVNVKLTGYSEVPDRILHPYALKDVTCTLELYYLLRGKLDGLPPRMKKLCRLEHEVLMASREMEDLGIDVDHDRCLELLDHAEADLSAKRNKLRELTGKPDFNPNSPGQVSAAVYTGSRSPTRWSEKSGLPKVDEVALLRSESNVGRSVLEWRRVSKALTTYLRPLAKRSEKYRTIHPGLNSAGAKTGRFSSSGPNLQNLPRAKPGSPLGEIRSVFVARPGFRFLFCDYDQIELRLAAHFSQEPHMVEAILQGQDLHGVTATKMFNATPEHPKWEFLRYLAKTLNFSILYGTGPAKFADTILAQSTKMGDPIVISVDEAVRYVRDYKATHPKIMQLFQDVDVEVRRTGGVTNFYGRFMEVPSWQTYVGVNYKIQSTAADVMKLALLRCTKFLETSGFQSRLILTVHDELIFEIHHTEKHLLSELPKMMEDTTTFSVPLSVSASLGSRWGEKKKLVATR